MCMKCANCFKMSNKHVKQMKLGDQIYNNTTAEYDSKKYRKNIAANWLSINQKEPPENYTPTVFESERQRSKSQHVPRQKIIPSQTKPSKRVPNSPIGDFDLNFDNNGPIDDFFDEENQFEFEEDRRPTATNTKTNPTRKRNHDNEFLDAGHSSEQKKRPHKADYPVEKKSKAKPNQVPIGDDFKLIPRQSRHLPTTSRARMPDLDYSSIEPFPINEHVFEQFSSPERESGNHQRKRNHQLSVDFLEMDEERELSREIMKYRINGDKRLPRKAPHSNSFRNIERDFDMPRHSPPVIIESRYQFNLEMPREQKQQRPIKDEFEDDFQRSFHGFDERKRQCVVQKTEKQIDLTGKSLKPAMDRRLEVFHDDLMAIPNRYTRHDVFPASRPIRPHSILPRTAKQPISYNIKCNNLIIKTDYPAADNY